jgi:predicted HNH restriction endonuclease
LLYATVAKDNQFSMIDLRSIGHKFPESGGAADKGAMTRAIKAGFVVAQGDTRRLTEGGLWRAQRVKRELERKGFATVREANAAGAIDLNDYEPENDGQALDSRILQMVIEDAGQEGTTTNTRAARLHRLTRLAQKFVIRRLAEGRFTCDVCNFDPAERVKGTKVRPRSLMDVHHRDPLRSGARVTKLTDSPFDLLCPTCHRFEHAQIDALQKNKRNADQSGLAKRLMEIGRHFSALPVFDDRTDDEILGYDKRGLPT